MNKPTISLIGNVGKADASYTPTGKFVFKGSIAVSIGYGDNKKTDWYNFVAWEKRGETMNKMIQKGTELYIEGDLEQQKWNDDSGRVSMNITVSKFKVTARGKPKDGEENPYDAVEEVSEPA